MTINDPEVFKRVCRRMAAKNLNRSVQQGYKSRVPFALEVLLAVGRTIRAWWREHLDGARKARRLHGWD